MFLSLPGFCPTMETIMRILPIANHRSPALETKFRESYGGGVVVTQLSPSSLQFASVLGIVAVSKIPPPFSFLLCGLVECLSAFPPLFCAFLYEGICCVGSPSFYRYQGGLCQFLTFPFNISTTIGRIGWYFSS